MLEDSWWSPLRILGFVLLVGNALVTPAASMAELAGQVFGALIALYLWVALWELATTKLASGVKRANEAAGTIDEG